jgi:hypothetical protein
MLQYFELTHTIQHSVVSEKSDDSVSFLIHESIIFFYENFKLIGK